MPQMNRLVLFLLVSVSASRGALEGCEEPELPVHMFYVSADEWFPLHSQLFLNCAPGFVLVDGPRVVNCEYSEFDGHVWDPPISAYCQEEEFLQPEALDSEATSEDGPHSVHSEETVVAADENIGVASEEEDLPMSQKFVLSEAKDQENFDFPASIKESEEEAETREVEEVTLDEHLQKVDESEPDVPENLEKTEETYDDEAAEQNKSDIEEDQDLAEFEHFQEEIPSDTEQGSEVHEVIDDKRKPEIFTNLEQIDQLRELQEEKERVFENLENTVDKAVNRFDLEQYKKEEELRKSQDLNSERPTEKNSNKKLDLKINLMHNEYERRLREIRRVLGLEQGHLEQQYSQRKQEIVSAHKQRENNAQEES